MATPSPVVEIPMRQMKPTSRVVFTQGGKGGVGKTTTTAALGAALTMAVFPSFVAVSRANGVDPLLIFLMVAACAATLLTAR